MFSTQHGVGDSDGYDFTKTENAARWRGLFTPSLKKVLEQVHSRLTAKEDALLYVETLCLRILAMLCAKPLPHSVQDVEEKVKKTFPGPIDEWALNEAKETVSSKKRKSVLPTDRVHSLLQKDVLQYKIDNSVSVFLVAVLEYISADILKLAGNYVKKIKHCEITKEDIEVAMCADKVLMDMFYQSDLKGNVLPNPATNQVQRTSTSYEAIVKDLIQDEKQFQRDLHMIIRVFREELVKVVRDTKELEPIFSNIMDIYEVTVNLLGSLEDVIEMSEEHTTPFIGSCFEELAEAEEFDVYTKYAQEVLINFPAIVLFLSVVTAQTNINDSSSGNTHITLSNTTTYSNEHFSSSNANGNQNNSTGLQHLFNNVGNWSGGFNGNLGYLISPRAGVTYSIGASAKVNWFTAQRICKYNGLTLATITSADIAKTIRNIIRETAIVSSTELFWIGATKYPDNGQYWSWFGSGNPAVYTNWAPGQPNRSADYCLQVGLNGWDDQNCNNQAYFICQSRC